MGQTKNFQIGDAPVQEEYCEQMKALAKAIDTFLNEDMNNKTTGFVLMVFPMGDEGRCNYMSNSMRVDVKVLLKEQLARFEGQAEVKGSG